MKNAERILLQVRANGIALCDDCLSNTLNITPRQTVNNLCRQMAKEGTISRAQGICARCGGSKLVNALTGPTHQPSHVSNPNITSSRNHDPTNVVGTEVSWAVFEARVGAYLQRTYNQTFAQQTFSKSDGWSHTVDWVSADGRILVECKSYNWTRSGNVPSGKIATLREAILYLRACPGERRIIAMHHRPFPNQEYLVDYFCRLNRGLLNGIEVWDFSIGTCPEEDHVRVVADRGSNGHSNLFYPSHRTE